MSELHDKLDNVRDRDTFFEFVQALVVDRLEMAKDEAKYPHGGQPGGWEHSTIDEYLAAAMAWAESSRYQPTGLSEQASWRGFAEFLYSGKIYE